MTYVRRASPLHAARPAVAIAYCAALCAAGLVLGHPLVLGTLVAIVAVVGIGARVGDRIAASARLGLWVAGLIFVIQPLVAREGLTVIARLGEVPPLGRLDITLEATVYGGVLALRALVIVLAFGLYAAAVDPDQVLALFRRRGLRSALTVTLATRMVPVLARDSRRLADGQRCRGSGSVSRPLLLRAIASGALDRAFDVAAALELRGYAGARRGPSRPRPWSRHDLAFAAAAIAIALLTVWGAASGTADFATYPRLHSASLARVVPLAAALAICAVAPLLDRRGIER